MDTIAAFAKGDANRGRPERTFDWDKARAILEERKPREASAGLIEDWFATGDVIWEGGAPSPDGSPYLTSTWATPSLVLEDADGARTVISCWVWLADARWPEGSYWPEAAA